MVLQHPYLSVQKSVLVVVPTLVYFQLKDLRSVYKSVKIGLCLLAIERVLWVVFHFTVIFRYPFLVPDLSNCL